MVAGRNQCLQHSCGGVHRADCRLLSNIAEMQQASFLTRRAWWAASVPDYYVWR